MKRGIYLIWDKAANDLVGLLQLHGNETVAIRTFGDLARMEKSAIGAHIEDMILYYLGDLLTGQEQPAIQMGEAPPILAEVVLTGGAWNAAQGEHAL